MTAGAAQLAKGLKMSVLGFSLSWTTQTFLRKAHHRHVSVIHYPVYVLNLPDFHCAWAVQAAQPFGTKHGNVISNNVNYYHRCDMIQLRMADFNTSDTFTSVNETSFHGSGRT